jgi:hypothetical protein
MKSTLKATLTIGIALLMSACAGTKPWTAEQRAQLTPIAVIKTQTPEKAFYKVSIKSYQMTRYTTGLAEVTPFAGAFIDAADAIQQSKFDSRYEPFLKPIEQTSQQGLDEGIAAKLKVDLETMPIFSGKVKDDASTKIKLSIFDTGFVRAGRDAGATSAVEGLPLGFGAIGHLELVDGQGKVLLYSKLRSQSKTIGDIPSLVANDYEMVKKMRGEVIGDLVDQVKKQIEIKLAPEK